MNKNNNKKQRIRVLKTGELGTVTDQVLMKRDGKPSVYKQVKLDRMPKTIWTDGFGQTN